MCLFTENPVRTAILIEEQDLPGSDSDQSLLPPIHHIFGRNVCIEVEEAPDLPSHAHPTAVLLGFFSRPSPHWIYSPYSASIHLKISSIDFQIIATLSKRRMQWLKINSKFIGILYGNYRIIMKWLPLGEVWVIGNPRWETRIFTVLELYF